VIVAISRRRNGGLQGRTFSIVSGRIIELLQKVYQSPVGESPPVVLAEPALPEGSKPLTEILRPIETRPDFAYFEELEDGKYKIEYLKKDGSKQKIEVVNDLGIELRGQAVGRQDGVITIRMRAARS
jgi:hypothetical protein